MLFPDLSFSGWQVYLTSKMSEREGLHSASPSRVGDLHLRLLVSVEQVKGLATSRLPKSNLDNTSSSRTQSEVQ